MKDGEIYDVDDQIVATFSSISSPEELKQFQPSDEQPDIVIVNLLDWQVSYRFLILVSVVLDLCLPNSDIKQLGNFHSRRIFKLFADS